MFLLTGVGLGWRIGAAEGRTVYHHGGDSLGGRAFLLLVPEWDISVALLANLSFAKIGIEDALRLARPFA